ncbi:MAG: fimbria major subunit [Tannerella sp.]|jgi:hypothetical protein|nr:fimbria major subunit [Tannerella sp.]
MKLKSLFLGMLIAALFAGCNNEGPIDGPNGNTAAGESTTATFQLKVYNPGTYAGENELAGENDENVIRNALLLVYKDDGAGTPEAMGYITGITSSSVLVTLKCTSGSKLIYLLTNIGTGTSAKMFDAGQTITNTETPSWAGASLDAAKLLSAINVPIWPGSSANTVQISSQVPQGSIQSVDALIKGLTGNGDPANGNTGGTPPTQGTANGYLMSNWGSDYPDNVNAGTSYVPTYKFTLVAGISADESRAATADETNSNGKNALKINVQRAVAKISVAFAPGIITNNNVVANAGSSTNAGKFTHDTKWAVGNINTSVYPIQEWDGAIVKGTLYDSVGAITANPNWAKVVDNSRWIPSAQSFVSQNLTITDVKTQIASSINMNFGTGNANRTLVTENNNSGSYSAYLTFIVFSGQYLPKSYITNVLPDQTLVKAEDANPNPPAAWGGAASYLDTMYYVGSFNNGHGLFFLGDSALKRYIGWVVLNGSATVDPAKAPVPAAVTAKIKELKEPNKNGKTHADLQAYYRGYCFYRVWVKDEKATAGLASQYLVRRNHIYDITITEVKGPGIGDPNDIVDPSPETADPVEDPVFETFVTATVNIMNWHIVGQNASAVLD